MILMIMQFKPVLTKRFYVLDRHTRCLDSSTKHWTGCNQWQIHLANYFSHAYGQSYKAKVANFDFSPVSQISLLFLLQHDWEILLFQEILVPEILIIKVIDDDRVFSAITWGWQFLRGGLMAMKAFRFSQENGSNDDFHRSEGSTSRSSDFRTESSVT